MRAHFIPFVRLFPTLGVAQWEPPAHPDPIHILQEARSDARIGNCEEALAKHLWFHNEAIKHNPSLYSARLSFALKAWSRLAQEYPPALVKLKEVRDATRELVVVAASPREAFSDIVAINRVLNDQDHTKDAFVELNKTNPGKARAVYDLAQPALIQANEFGLCAEFLQPAEDFAKMDAAFGRMQRAAEASPNGVQLRLFANHKFENDVATLVALLVVNDRQKDAEIIATRAKNVDSSPKLLRIFRTSPPQ